MAAAVRVRVLRSPVADCAGNRVKGWPLLLLLREGPNVLPQSVTHSVSALSPHSLHHQHPKQPLQSAEPSEGSHLLPLSVVFPASPPYSLRCSSSNALSLLKGLLTREPAQRLGSGPGGAEAVKKHPFFKCISWTKLEARELESKFKPAVKCSLVSVRVCVCVS